MRGRVAIALAIAAACACNALNGAGDFDVCDGDCDAGSAPLPPAPPAPPEVDASPPFAPGCDAGPCAVELPPGFAVVLFESARDPCAAGASPVDVVEDAGARPGACNCATCTVTTPPSCNGTVDVAYDFGGGTCAANTVGFEGDGGCQPPPSSGFTPPNLEVIAPSPDAGGACTAGAISDAKMVTTAPSRVCASPSCDACGSPGSGYAVCVAANGDRACPPSLPVKHLVGDSASVTACGACSTCTVSAKSCTGTLTLYGDMKCASPTGVFDAGACTAATPSPYSSYRWVGAAQNVKCTASGPGAATISLAAEKTVCCAK